MVITLLLSSLLGSFIGAGLGLYWNVSGVMIGLYYVLGGMVGVTAFLWIALSRLKEGDAPLKAPAPETASQLSNQKARLT